MTAPDGMTHEVGPLQRMRIVPCPDCWMMPGKPCGPAWDHLARYGRANRRGLVSALELEAATAAAELHGETLAVSYR
jgi:hypothetical protein